MNQMFAAGRGFMGIGAWEVVTLLVLLVGAIVLVAAGFRLALWWRDR